MKWMLAGVAALAMAASGALAQPGNGNGGNRGGNAQAAAPGNGPADHGNRGSDRQQQTGNGNGNGNADRARPQQADRGNGNGNGNSQARRQENPVSEVRGAARSARDDARRADGAIDAGRNAVARERDDRGEWRDAPLRYIYGRDDDRHDGSVRYIGLLDGCPPGLAAKHNGCQPPGQARKHGYFQRDGYNLGWWGLPRWDDRLYRYDSGYLVRITPDGRIGAYIPLLGGALAIGNRWPSDYGYDRMSPYYADYYGLGPSYRYADNVVYRLDPETALIQSVAALLTGDEFVVGQPLPGGYDVYNVPYRYRDRYVDRPDAWYRYSDGYVYQIDPETRLVAAAIELLL